MYLFVLWCAHIYIADSHQRELAGSIHDQMGKIIGKHPCPYLPILW